MLKVLLRELNKFPKIIGIIKNTNFVVWSFTSSLKIKFSKNKIVL